MGWNLDLFSETQKFYMGKLENAKHSGDEMEIIGRSFRTYNRFCIRNGLAYVEDMTNEEFDEFANFLSSRCHSVAASDVKTIKSYLAFLLNNRSITPDDCKYRMEKLDGVITVNSRSKYKNASDFVVDGKDMSGFFYVSSEHFIHDVMAINPNKNYNSSIVVMILAWNGFSSVEIANMSESQVSRDCSVIHTLDKHVIIPCSMQQIMQDYRESDVESSLLGSNDSGDVYEKVTESSLFIKKRKAGPKHLGKKSKVSNEMGVSVIRQRVRDYSAAVSVYHNRPITLTVQKMQTFPQLYRLANQIADSQKETIPYIESLKYSWDEKSRLIRLLREREAFINANEEVKAFLPH